MSTIKSAEDRIYRLEGFKVRFCHIDGRDVRSDLRLRGQYDFERAAAGSQSVSDWVRSRFETCYPGFRAEVLDAAGRAVHGRTKLDNVRGEYRIAS